MKQNFDFARSVTTFLTDYLVGEKGMSDNTIRSYSYTFILLLKYMKEEKHIDADRLTLKSMTKVNIVAFLDWLQRERNCGNATRNLRLAAIIAFARFLEYKYPASLYDCQQIISIPAKKSEGKIISFLTEEGVKLLLGQPDKSTVKGLRDFVLIALMYESGARVQEIIDLTPSSLRIQSTPLCVILHGKGNKNRLVPLPEDLGSAVKEYMKRSGLDKREDCDKPLFPNRQGQKMTRNGINNVLVKYAQIVREKNPTLAPPKISCHSMRHSKAMALLEAGVELMHIRDFLGHKSVLTTEIYAKVNPKFTFEAVRSAYGNISDEIPMWEGDDKLMKRLKELAR